MTKQELILDFIKQFRDLGAKNCFSSGMCYYFAKILSERFPDGVIVYDEIANHFGYAYEEKTYDITGIVTDSYSWKMWSLVQKHDPALATRITRDCIDKIPAGVTTCRYCRRVLLDPKYNLHKCKNTQKVIDLNAPCYLKEEI